MSSADNKEQEIEFVPGQEYHIPIPKHNFLAKLCSLLDDMPGDQKLFAKLCSAIEALFYLRKINKTESFKNCYSYFERRNRLLSWQMSKTPEQELAVKQNQLLAYIFSTIYSAKFQPISNEMYKNAMENAYLVDLPITVDWSALDSNLLTRFFKRFPQCDPYKDIKDNEDKPPFHQHFSVFYRGLGLHSQSGLFITPKVNLLIQDSRRFFCSLVRKFGLKVFVEFMITFTSYESDEDVISAFNLGGKQEGESKQPEDATEFSNNPLHKHRVSLLGTYNKAKAEGAANGNVLKSIALWFMDKVRLQEPTFRKLILVYRSFQDDYLAQQLRIAKQSSRKLSHKNLSKLQRKLSQAKIENLEQEILKTVRDSFSEEDKDSDVSSGDDQNGGGIDDAIRRSKKSAENSYHEPIRIQYFSEIPISDLEVSYPCQQLSLKSVDTIYFGLTLILGIYAILSGLFCTNSAFGTIPLFIFILLMLRSINWYMNTERTYVQTVSQLLFNSSISTDKDVLLSLVDSVDEQQFMETILAYFVLHMKDTIVDVTSSKEVDRLCEQFLNKEFGSKEVNVKVSGAVKRLRQLGLFENGGNLRVKSLQDALSSLHEHFIGTEKTFRKLERDINLIYTKNNCVTDGNVDDGTFLGAFIDDAGF